MQKCVHLTEKDYIATVDMFADEIYRFALCICQDAALADDAVQEAFAALWERRAKVPKGEDARRFLLVVAKRKLQNYWRRREREMRAVGEIAVSVESQTDPYDRADMRDAIWKAMSELTPKQRTVLTLHDIEGYDYEEIAELTGEKYTTVQVTLFRARVKMRELLSMV